MKPADLHGRLRPSRAGVRLRILAGLAVLLVTGLSASSVTGALLMGDYLHKRYVHTVQESATRLVPVESAVGVGTVVTVRLGARGQGAPCAAR